MQPSDNPTQRVAVYIDGFNLYYSLRAKEWRYYYWLNIHRFAEALLESGQELVKVRYFTSRIAVRSDRPGDKDRQRRQNIYLDALATLSEVDIHYGKHSDREQTCPECDAVWQQPEEKMTDVNLAVEALGDAQDDLFDIALIVSGDTDLVGLVQAVGKRYPGKEVVIVFPGRRANALVTASSRSRSLSENALATSQFPDRVPTASGYVLERPPSWV